MRITESQLRRIIRNEIRKNLQEGWKDKLAGAALALGAGAAVGGAMGAQSPFGASQSASDAFSLSPEEETSTYAAIGHLIQNGGGASKNASSISSLIRHLEGEDIRDQVAINAQEQVLEMDDVERSELAELGMNHVGSAAPRY